MMKIGVLSDTHDHFDPAIRQVFARVDHIFHGGDIGLPWLILELENLAPVTAVLGNTDGALNVKETEIVELAGRKFLLHHIVDVAAPCDTIRHNIAREKPDVVVFGHTHRRYCQRIGETLYFNPGYAGKPRFGLPRSVAILTCHDGLVSAQYFDL